jgi:class 3 adenylate cyclase
VDVQVALIGVVWPEGVEMRVRMGLHTGQSVEQEGNYLGAPLNRAARLMAAAHGGQVVVSEVTASLVAGTSGIRLIGAVERFRGRY